MRRRVWEGGSTVQVAEVEKGSRKWAWMSGGEGGEEAGPLTPASTGITDDKGGQCPLAGHKGARPGGRAEASQGEATGAPLGSGLLTGTESLPGVLGSPLLCEAVLSLGIGEKAEKRDSGSCLYHVRTAYILLTLDH